MFSDMYIQHEKYDEIFCLMKKQNLLLLFFASCYLESDPYLNVKYIIFCYRLSSEGNTFINCLQLSRSFIFLTRQQNTSTHNRKTGLSLKTIKKS